MSFLWIRTSFANDNTMNYVVWNHQPITVTLPLHAIKLLRFSNPVAVGIPQSLQNNLNVDNQAGIVKLTATKAFAKTRIEVKDTTNGNVILLTIVTTKTASTVPLTILYKAPSQNNADNVGWLKAPSALNGEIAYVTLTRFAEQDLYAPKRLQKNPYGIQLTQSYMAPNGGVKPKLIFHNLFYDHSTINLPWATWHGGNVYVTAVMVRNVLSIPIDLHRNLTLLCGRDNRT